MTKDELIAKQQLEIESFKEKRKINKEVLKKVNNKLYGIGQPLNDNILKMDKKQLLYLLELNGLIEDIE